MILFRQVHINEKALLVNVKLDTKKGVRWFYFKATHFIGLVNF